MRPRQRIDRAGLFASALLLTGCTITFGPADESGAPADHSGSALPEPEHPTGEGPVLDAAQQARKKESERYVAEVIYKGSPIAQTIQLPSGDIIDGVERAMLPALPYALPPLPWSPQDLTLPPGVELGLTDIEQLPELLDLATHAASFHRPTFWPYVLGETDATSIQDYLDHYQVGGQPSGNRLYAGLVSLKPNRGISGYMNQFRPEVALGSFSLLEFAVACPADGIDQEVVGVVISVDKVNSFGKHQPPLTDGEPRLHIEYARTQGGKTQYSWDGLDGQFVANPFRRYRPGQIVPVSALGGPQVEHLIAIFQAPTGDWWIAYRQELLGYYPAKLFTLLKGGACKSSWYGEVFNPDPENSAVETELGSGKPAEVGRPHTAYVRNPTYYDLSWFGVEPTEDLFMGPYVPSCYTRSALLKSAAPWNSVFLFGGPGGKDPQCKWPFP